MFEEAGQWIIMILTILIFLILSTSFVFSNSIFSNSNCHKSEYFDHTINNSSTNNIKWNRNDCPYLMSKTLENVLNENKIFKDSANGWQIYFPCSYDEIEKEIDQMPVKNNAKYFIIDNVDTMTAKEWLWKNVVNHHGIEKAKTMIPNGYILYSSDDINRFNNEYDSEKLYILKKNIQRQEGLKISNNKSEIMNGFKSNFVIAQELLQNPYIIDGRKTNMRFYVLVVCNSGNISVYVFNDGFMYYTKVPFRKNDPSIDVNVTTGYIDRDVYKVNPLTHEDLRNYLDDPNRNLNHIEFNIRKQGLKISQIYFDRINELLRNVFLSFVGNICVLKKFNNNVIFQLFGVDIAVNDMLQPMVMEINKGPDMGAKDTRDSELKHNVIRDMFRLIGVDVVAKNNNGFNKILEVDNGVIYKNL